MNLRLTTLLIIAVTFAGLLLVLSVTTREVLTNHFENMEQQSVLLSLDRANRLVESDYDGLDRITQEWVARGAVDALWQADPAYFSDLNIGLLLLVDAGGNIQQAYTGEEGSPALPDDLLNQIYAGSEADSAEVVQLQESVRGLIALWGEPLLVVGEPLPGEETLVVGRWLDSTELNRLTGILQLPITLIPYDNPGSGVNLAAYYALLEGQNAFIYALDESQIAGFIRLETPTDTPSYLLRIEQPRQFYLSGQRVQALIVVALVTVGAVFAIIIVLFLELMIFSRLTRLSKEVNEIRPGELNSRRVSVSQQDELSQLGSNINAMLDSLEQAQIRRMEAQNELRSRIDDLLALNDTSVELITRLDAPNTLEKVCRLVVEKFGLELAWIGSWDEDRTRLQPVAIFGCDQAELPEIRAEDDQKDRKSFSWPAYQALHANKTVVSTSDVTCGGKVMRTQAAFLLPLNLPQSFVLILFSQSNRFFTPNRLRSLEAFANLAGIALQNAGLFTQVQEGRTRQEMLSRRLVELQEEERRSIAMELHDEIGQILTGLNLMLGVPFSTDTPEQRERLENAHRLVNELIGRVRQMSLTLRPAMLDDLGLLPTLLWHFENYTRQTGIRVDFHHSELEGQRFSTEIETTMYRVVQEALTNVARHAGVKQAVVQIWVLENTIHVQVEDEGTGFNAAEITRERGTFGLLGMQERAVLLNGSLTIDTQPGRGTSLYMQIPLASTGEHSSTAEGIS
jgi:signal transduction histidine kinase/sensor domain CHASE-containing protein